MAHQRNRYLKKLIEKAQHLSPLIGLLGHRQVGKTTLAEVVTKDYLTLDDLEQLNLARKSPQTFLQTHKKYLQGIDECQLAPELFPALKEQVRVHKSPGQYLLTGSVRFTSRKAIKESLTGRIINFELLPFTISEMAHLPLPETLFPFFSDTSIEKIIQIIQIKKNNISSGSKEYKYYFDHGGLPGVCFIRDSKLRNLKIKEQLITILDRDIRLIYPTSLVWTQIYDLLKYIAKNQGQRINYTEIRKLTGISLITQKKLLMAMEAVFLLRRIPVEGSFQGEVYYLEDQAESYFLNDNKMNSTAIFEQTVYRNLRAQFYYSLGKNFREFYFETRGGSRIPYAISCEGYSLGILPIEDESPNRSEIANAASFLKMYQNSRVLYLNLKKEFVKIDNRSLNAPVYFFI